MGNVLPINIEEAYGHTVSEAPKCTTFSVHESRQRKLLELVRNARRLTDFLAGEWFVVRSEEDLQCEMLESELYSCPTR